MRRKLRDELSTWAQYFLIALLAEFGAALGWLDAQYKGSEDLVFNALNKLIDHERTRLFWWFLIFLVLSIIRFLIHRYMHSGGGDEQIKPQ